MIAGCPKCSARYRVDADRIGGGGAKLRCTKCSAVFLVRAPRAASSEPPRTAAPAKTSSERSQQTVASPAASSGTGAAPIVLVADPDEARAKSTAFAIEQWGLKPLVVHDGVEAMLAIARSKPSVVVLDAALPKMYGFQVCEVVKRVPSLASARVVLVGAIHQESRYRRDPSDLHGADVYLEQPDLPEGLHPLLKEAGLPVGDLSERMRTEMRAQAPPSSPGPAAVPPAPTAPAPPQAPPAPPASEAVPSAGVSAASEDEPFVFESEIPAGPAEPTAASAPPRPSVPPTTPEAAGGTEDPGLVEEIERAERLARIAVSEMVLYQPEKFDQAARDGNLTQVLDLEIQEARALIRQRVSEPVRAERDFILEELGRVAKERGNAG